ncbi:MAG TPA: SDR family NAD(P)-dependent oxidoreductase [Polyangiaceae bacterium]|nr:SDR family NAD(P)-dependent oxidoreductase [Polyangiaceae bacterium]
MSKTIIVCGYGPGVSKAVAEKFGAEGFSVALASRSADKLSAGVKALEARGIKAAAFPTDLGDPASVKALVASVRKTLGPISVLQWSAYSGAAGDLLQADARAVHGALDVATVGVLAAVQEALPDLEKDASSAVLITNGGFGLFDPQIDATVVQYNAMGLALANAAKHKLCGLLAEKLKTKGVYLGELMVLGTVKGTAFDQGQATLEASAIADKFWALYSARKESSVTFG